MRPPLRIRCVPHALVLALALLTVGPAFAATARITYLAGRSVYLDAGRAEGLGAGDTARVLRDGRVIAELRVTFVSTHRVACDTAWTREPLAVGDVARFTPRAPDPAAGVPPASPARDDSIRTAAVLDAPAARAERRDARMRGRLGLRWLEVRTDGAGSIQQPAIEARWDGRDRWNGHLDATLDVRGRRTVQSNATSRSAEQYSRVHRASATFRDRAGTRRLSLGRQTSPTLASVSLFDGALAEWGGARHSVGVFGGTQPEPARLGWSRDLVEGGAYLEWHQAPLASERWSLSVGGVSSRSSGEPNRDFAFGQGWWSSTLGHASIAQEVDLNPAWKRSRGEPAVSWTSTFATVRASVGSRAALQAGYDNRRNVRLWRDHETPETDFDDRYRQGAWLGATVEPDPRLRGGVEYRRGSAASTSDTWSVHGELRRSGRWRESLRARWSSWSSGELESELWSFALGVDPLVGSHLELSTGMRGTTDRLAELDETERWHGLDLDLALGGRWYVSSSFEAQHGISGTTRQLQGGLSVRL